VHLAHLEELGHQRRTKFIKEKFSEYKMIQKWNQVIQISSPAEFQSAFSHFSSQYGSNFQKYMDSQWLPISEKYSNAWTKSITHFNNQTTS